MVDQLKRWLPAILMMASIFIFSSVPSDEFPSFYWADALVKKGGHMLGYGLLALSYWYAFRWERGKWWLPWLLAVVYAITDEIHQSFVPGRHPSLVDVLVFDNLGALIALWLTSLYLKRK